MNVVNRSRQTPQPVRPVGPTPGGPSQNRKEVRPVVITVKNQSLPRLMASVASVRAVEDLDWSIGRYCQPWTPDARGPLVVVLNATSIQLLD